jgi:hypothetical protein
LTVRIEILLDQQPTSLNERGMAAGSKRQAPFPHRAIRDALERGMRLAKSSTGRFTDKPGELEWR